MPSRPRRRAVQALLLLLTSLVCSGVAADADAPGAALAVDLQRIDDGLFVHLGRHEQATLANAADIANLVVVVGQSSVAIIDPGGSLALSMALQRAVRALSDLPVSHVVLTHAHPDHVLGAAVFGAPGRHAPVVIAHERFERARAHRLDIDLARLGALVPPGPLLAPSVRLAEGDSHEIDLGKRTLTVTALGPAHTDHDLLVVDVERRTLIASDVVVGQRLPALHGSLPGWLTVLERIAQMPLERIVPGHGTPATPAELLVPMRAYLSELRDGVRADIARGESLGAAVRRAERAHGRADRWQLFALHHPFNVTRAWAELEWQ